MTNTNTSTIPAVVSIQATMPAGDFVSINTLLCEAFRRIPLSQRAVCEIFLDAYEDAFVDTEVEFTESAYDWAANAAYCTWEALTRWLAKTESAAYWMEYVVNECPDFFSRKYDFYGHIQKAQTAYFEDCILSNKGALVYILVLKHLLKRGVTYVSIGDPLDLLENMGYEDCERPAVLFNQVDDLLVDESEEE